VAHVSELGGRIWVYMCMHAYAKERRGTLRGEERKREGERDRQRERERERERETEVSALRVLQCLQCPKERKKAPHAESMTAGRT
jgi:hypothetical protein